jgi:hypothetical protein
MKRPSIYVKMKVLGAIDVVEGRTRDERIHQVAGLTFLDEEGNPHRFTWRTIQTWHYRYKNHGVTGMTSGPRADKGVPRKVTPEETLEAINAALPHFRQKKHNKSALYRFGCNSHSSMPQSAHIARIAQFQCDDRGTRSIVR